MTGAAVNRPESHGERRYPAGAWIGRAETGSVDLSGPVCAVTARHDPQFQRGGGRRWWLCTCGLESPHLYRTATGAQLAYGWHLLAVERLRGAPCS